MNNTSQEEIRGYNAQLQTELASCKKKVKELEVLNRRLTERWEGAKLRYAEDSQHITELEAEHTALVDGLRELYEGSVQYQEFRSVYDGSLPVDPNVYLKIKRDELLTLLGKES